MKNNLLKVALAQISPVWLNKEKTIKKIEKSIIDAAK
jgi:nitrilase